MSAGKSLYVLQRAYTLDQAGFRPLVAKPSFDTRDVGVVRSRIGIERECVLLGDPIERVAEFEQRTTSFPTHLLVDEAQFLTRNQVQSLQYIADSWGIPISAYGLRTSYTGELFEGSAALLAIADDIEELPLTYSDGNKANMHLRVEGGSPTFDGPRNIVGDVGEYRSVSRAAWFELKDEHDGLSWFDK